MNKIKKEFLGKQVLGAPGSAMQVLSMWLMKKSRKVVLVTRSMKDECVGLPKPKSQLAQLDDDGEDVFTTSLIDRYGARPVSLQNMCLATFAVTYDVIQSATKKETDGGNDEEEEMQNTENDNSLTRIKCKKNWVSSGKGNRKQYYIQEGKKFIQNQKIITIQSYCCIIHRIMKMTSYHHLQLNMSHTSVSKISYTRMQKDSMKTVWHLTWTGKIWKTIYHSLHGRWLLQI